jgi:hypothetical protein
MNPEFDPRLKPAFHENSTPPQLLHTKHPAFNTMPPPSPLAIATSVVQRLVKEETSYHKELKSQEARLEKLVSSTEADENKEYQLKQEVCQPATIQLRKGIFVGLG